MAGRRGTGTGAASASGGASRARVRHGRALRSSATGPQLAPLRGRGDLFRQTVLATSEYLGSLWPNELADVVVETASIPEPAGGDRVPRWVIDRTARRIVLFRIPIERLGPASRYDEVQYRYLVESCVFQAVAEYLGKDPWDIAPERFR